VLATGAVKTIAGTPGVSGNTDGTGGSALFHGPQGLALDGAGNLYVADTVNRTVRKIALPNAVVTTLVGSIGQQGVKLGRLPGGLGQPGFLAIAPTGALVITDNAENSVLAVR
jgi:DNA-binding beta-propeller fold protein YncE